jgi:flagellum-specific peptidoglycan hydrolase FlgJ
MYEKIITFAKQAQGKHSNMKFLKHIATTTLAAATLANATAQNISRAQYIERYAPIAVAHAEKYGIPASIKMAQGILESGGGNGTLARQGNSHFNIKVKKADNWRGRVVYHDDDRPTEPFRAYDTPEESWTDHSEYLDRQPRYDSLFDYGTTDYHSWARGLKAAGYATDPLYAEKLVRIIEENELWRLDREGLAALKPAATVTVAPPPPAAPIAAATEGFDPDRFTAIVRQKDTRSNPATQAKRRGAKKTTSK